MGAVLSTISNPCYLKVGIMAFIIILFFFTFFPFELLIFNTFHVDEMCASLVFRKKVLIKLN